MSPHIKIDTLIVSDLHLGSRISRTKDLEALLSRHAFKRLILLGDIFDSSDFQGLNDENWRLLSMIRDMSKPENGREVIWIRGNHDKEIDSTVSRLFGSKVYDEYVWEHNNKRFLAVHGDQFDTFLDYKTRAHALGHRFFLLMQKFDKDGRHIVRLLDRMNTRLRGLSRKVANGAIQYAKELQSEYVFCGHTHVAMKKVRDEQGSRIHYYNVGCWTYSPSTFAAIDEGGNILLERFAA